MKLLNHNLKSKKNKKKNLKKKVQKNSLKEGSRRQFHGLAQLPRKKWELQDPNLKMLDNGLITLQKRIEELLQ